MLRKYFFYFFLIFLKFLFLVIKSVKNQVSKNPLDPHPLLDFMSLKTYYLNLDLKF